MLARQLGASQPREDRFTRGTHIRNCEKTLVDSWIPRVQPLHCEAPKSSASQFWASPRPLAGPSPCQCLGVYPFPEYAEHLKCADSAVLQACRDRPHLPFEKVDGAKRNCFALIPEMAVSGEHQCVWYQNNLSLASM